MLLIPLDANTKHYLDKYFTEGFVFRGWASHNETLYIHLAKPVSSDYIWGNLSNSTTWTISHDYS